LFFKKKPSRQPKFQLLNQESKQLNSWQPRHEVIPSEKGQALPAGRQAFGQRLWAGKSSAICWF
jgi:hypothetical protein